ncbi:CPBP family intramembrane metalloprotease [Chloroflexi bacterium TSY]|nr:CPBP family intramembrane metalloprotease [Chloroflexi bacterium TSY]
MNHPAIAAAIGTALAPRVGLRAPFFEALVAKEPVWPALTPQLVPTFLVGIGGSLLFVVVYYGVVRPRLDRQTLMHADNLRRKLGVWGRLLYGGIVEEILTRWGLMSLLVWGGVWLSGAVTSGVVWTAIVITGILFGLGHLPAHFAVGCRKTPIFIGSVIGLNLWVSLIFGWLFWQVGLLAAIVAHMLFHLVWLPFELSTQS